MYLLLALHFVEKHYNNNSISPQNTTLVSNNTFDRNTKSLFVCIIDILLQVSKQAWIMRCQRAARICRLGSGSWCAWRARCCARHRCLSWMKPLPPSTWRPMISYRSVDVSLIYIYMYNLKPISKFRVICKILYKSLLTTFLNNRKWNIKNKFWISRLIFKLNLMLIWSMYLLNRPVI